MAQAREARHGSVVNPPSRAQKYLAEWQAAGLESGKFFPATEAGLKDPYAPDDTPNVQPPQDGRIASAGKDFAVKLDEPDSVQNWDKHPVPAGRTLDITWSYHARHKTRRWNYFLTRNGWDPAAPLTRAQFDSAPIATFQNDGQPYWEADLMPEDPTIHSVTLPSDRQGYHVLLSAWEVADTGNAFYQVIDLDIT
ncbi:lytic polysaccharide monooxygenase auxiliary activity family 9 protein [Streptomyces sp. NPDC050856]|uniref:lytic polysaccharide monooxygenase auxiliary activity family 9 protein n=1 Tax=Streptomyces sp. NPDC050856 TaxID=3154939 RepID=UPI00340A9FDB